MTTHRAWMIAVLGAATNAAADPAAAKRPVKDIVQPVKIEKQPVAKQADLAALAGALAGTWHCTGPGNATATNKVALDLDDGWLVENLDVQNGKTHKKLVAYTTFRSDTATWNRVVFEPNGEMLAGMSVDGLKDGAINWTLADPNGTRAVRERFDVADGKPVKLTSEIATDGKHWSKRYELTCKK